MEEQQINGLPYDDHYSDKRVSKISNNIHNSLTVKPQINVMKQSVLR